MQTKTKIIALSVATVVGVTAAAFAGFGRDSDDRREHRAEHIAEHLAKRLELTDAQEEQVNAIVQTALAERNALRQEAKEEIQQIILQDSMDKEGALRILTIREEMREAAQEVMAEQMVAVHALLTPEQREKAAEMLPRMGQRGKHRRGWLRGWFDRD